LVPVYRTGKLKTETSQPDGHADAKVVLCLAHLTNTMDLPISILRKVKPTARLTLSWFFQRWLTLLPPKSRLNGLAACG
jgi:hypothetical protein